ncbi:hypothetical protein B0T18DRAFT_395700 [Schizothecium vesticola]|uniref:Uncharacterized protein n=1 Tax=Schizothecium vesticola TaxID=314040 RepID=A0AA40F844_9PEZI|nr:hypothetical protein B0T18DRAFT_395700 [Schizothecium vesticola]
MGQIAVVRDGQGGPLGPRHMGRDGRFEGLMQRIINTEALKTFFVCVVCWAEKRPGRTENGFVCALEGETYVGDVIAVLDGTSQTFVLREAGNGEYRIVSHAYAHAIS